MRAGLVWRLRAKSMRYRWPLAVLWVNIKGRWYDSAQRIIKRALRAFGERMGPACAVLSLAAA